MSRLPSGFLAVCALFAIALAACDSPKLAAPPTTSSIQSGASPAESKDTISDEQILAARSHVAGCWYFDPGVNPASLPAVEVQVALRPDGSVRSAEVIDKARMTTDANFRMMAEAAVRAVWKCSPFNFPRDEYQIWKSTTFRFNP